MAFDPSKDKKLTTTLVAGDSDTFIEVALVRYDEGEEKIQLARFMLEDSENPESKRKWRKLGRLTLREAASTFEAGRALLVDLEAADRASD